MQEVSNLLITRTRKNTDKTKATQWTMLARYTQERTFRGQLQFKNQAGRAACEILIMSFHARKKAQNNTTAVFPTELLPHGMDGNS